MSSGPTLEVKRLNSFVYCAVLLRPEHITQALDVRKSAKLKKCYYDLEDMLQTNPSGNMPYTPSIPLLYGLKESLRLLKAEGMENVVARHHR